MLSARQQASDGRISEGPPRQIGVRWPIGVNKLLDDLVERANDAGAKCNRRELTASLVVDAHGLTGDELREMLVRYRRAKVEDIIPGSSDKTGTRGRSTS